MRLVFRVEYHQGGAASQPSVLWARRTEHGIHVCILGGEALLPAKEWDATRDLIGGGTTERWRLCYAGTDAGERLREPATAAREAAVRALHRFTPPADVIERLASARGAALPEPGVVTLGARRAVVAVAHRGLASVPAPALELFRAGLLHRFSVSTSGQPDEGVFYRPSAVLAADSTVLSAAAHDLLDAIEAERVRTVA